MSKLTFQPFPNIQSIRISLCEYSESDIATIFELRSHPEVIKYIKRPAYISIDEAIAFYDKNKKGVETNTWISWKICVQKSSQMIGSICLWNFSENQKTAEIGYDLLPQYHGIGIMSEAMKLVLNYGFTHLNLENILAYTDKRNDASKALLKKHQFLHLKNQFDKHNDMNEIYELIKKQ